MIRLKFETIACMRITSIANDIFATKKKKNIKPILVNRLHPIKIEYIFKLPAQFIFQQY